MKVFLENEIYFLKKEIEKSIVHINTKTLFELILLHRPKKNSIVPLL